MRADKSLEYIAFDPNWPDAIVVRRASRRLSLKVRADGVPLVSAPTRLSSSQVKTWLRTKRSWLGRQLDRQRHTYAELSGNRLTPSINIKHVLAPRLQAELNGPTLVVSHPPSFNQWHLLYRLARPALKRALHLEATPRLAALVKRLAIQTEQHPSAVRIRFMRSRWGSCSSSGSITLNSQLVRLPDPLIVYVVVHELTHLRHRHHQAGFWQALANTIPDYQQRRKNLREWQLFD